MQGRTTRTTEILPDTTLKSQEILDAFPFYVILVDAQHQILMANKAVEQTLGIARVRLLYDDKILSVTKYWPLHKRIMMGGNGRSEGL